MRKILLSLAVFVGLASQAAAADNYAATAGSGLTFAAKEATGVLYSRFIGCDNTTVSQCWSVDSSGRLLSYLGSGAVVDLGAIADAAATAGSTGSVNAKLRLMTSQLDSINTNIQAGSGATGSAVPSSAIYGAGISRSSEPSATSTGNLFGDFNDLVGKRVTSPYANRENMVRGAASATGTGATTIIAASGSASLKTYVTDIECGRTDAGTTAIFVTLNDVGGTGSGTVLIIPAGGGNNKSFHVPLVTAANTAFTFTASSGVTTLYCSAQGFTGY